MDMDRRKFLGSLGMGTTFASFRPDALPRILSACKSLDGASPEDVARDEDFWFQVRHAFTIDRNQINLNSGSVSPSPRVVQEAMKQYLTIFNMSPSLWTGELLYPEQEALREGLADMFGCDREELAITRNTTESLQIIQLGMPLERGDEILTTTQDYPTMLTSWRQRERRDGVVLKTVSIPTPADSDQLFDVFEKNITPRTRVIHFCHITYTAGQIFPVKRICSMARERGIETIVDGAHAFAHFPYKRDDLDCDYYGTSLHKWLTAPLGTGFLYVRKEKIPGIWPLLAAPQSLENNIRKFEYIGTHAISNRNAIGEALTFNRSIGIDRKAARLRYLKDRWMDRVAGLTAVQILTPRSPELSCAIGTMRIDGIGASDLTEHLLKKYRIHIRPRFVPDEWEGIRVTPNVFTTLEEVDAFADAIEEIVAGRGSVRG
jgi:selenocysteine lyase/cysteine desulfurase